MATTLIAKIAARAKQLRAKSPSMTWQSALKKAGAEYRGTNVKTTSKRPTVKAKRGRPLKRKSKVGDPIYNAYKKAPIAIKKIIDQLGDEPDYKQLQRAAMALKKKGYFMDYGLDAGITALRPIKKTTKKIGVTLTLLPEHKPYFTPLTLAAARKRYNENKKEVYGLRKDGSESLIKQQYDFNNSEFYAFGAEKNIVVSGSKKRVVGGPKPNLKPIPYKGFTILFSYGMYEARKGTVVVYGHSIANIKKEINTYLRNNGKSMSGVKKPKVQKADVDMSALNGVIKFQANKFYEVAKGANKGSVIKITSVRKPTNKNEGSALVTSYNVNFYEYRDGHLCKPFLGVITDRWLNKRSIRPRQSVKSTELKKYI